MDKIKKIVVEDEDREPRKDRTCKSNGKCANYAKKVAQKIGQSCYPWLVYRP